MSARAAANGSLVSLALLGCILLAQPSPALAANADVCQLLGQLATGIGSDLVTTGHVDPAQYDPALRKLVGVPVDNFSTTACGDGLALTRIRHHNEDLYTLATPALDMSFGIGDAGFVVETSVKAK